MDDIPEECIREFTNDKGETKRYLNFHIYRDIMPKHKTNRRGNDIVYTHNMVAMPAKFGSGKVQIAMLEERTSPFDGKEHKKTKEKKDKSFCILYNSRAGALPKRLKGPVSKTGSRET